MTEIDQIRRPAATNQVVRVQRKKRSARDSNKEQRPSKSQPREDDNRREHIDETV